MEALLRFGAVFIALASLVLGETTIINGAPVRRSSLLGYEVAGRVLDLDVAAAMLATAPELAPTLLAAQAPHPDLLRGPTESFGAMTETWRAGPACSRREGQLRRALGPGVSRSTTRSRWGEPVKVCLRYAASAKVPPIALDHSAGGGGGAKTPAIQDPADRRILKTPGTNGAIAAGAIPTAENKGTTRGAA